MVKVVLEYSLVNTSESVNSREEHIRAEIKKSKKKIDKLTKFLRIPQNELDAKSQNVYKAKLIILDLVKRKIISKDEEMTLRRSIAPVAYEVILSSPDVINNEERKKKITTSLRNDWLRLSSLHNVIRFVNC